MKKMQLFLRKNPGKCRNLLHAPLWMLLFLISGVLPLEGRTLTQLDNGISINVRDALLKDVLWQVERQIPFTFMYNNEDLDRAGRVSVNVSADTVEEIVDACLRGTGLDYVIQDQVIVIRNADLQGRRAQQPEPVIVRGRVTNQQGQPLTGVTVIISGTATGVSTDGQGRYQLSLPRTDGIVLVFSYVGMKRMEVTYTGQPEINVSMEEDAVTMDATVVSTGMYHRDINSFTGSFSSFKGDQLRTVSPQNALVALKSLDPAFRINESNLYGSDPNRLPDVDIRGKASIVNGDDLQNQYGKDPNSPIFILDEFEVSLQTVVDLDMDRIENMYVLKDASATAMYGSRAANGVIVIETKRPKPGKINVSYSGSLLINAPDLSDYNMMNAAEKLQFETLAGYYRQNSGDPETNASYRQLYNKRRSWVESGVDSYWLSEPVRVGFTHKHNLTMMGGSETMYYRAGINYAGNEGVMKQSGNDVLGFNVNLTYRVSKISFVNETSFDYRADQNAPVGFSEYVGTNPYYPKTTTDRYLDVYRIYVRHGGYTTTSVANPLYDASQNYLDGSDSYVFRNKTQMEYRVSDQLRVSGKISFNKRMNKTELFRSPYLTAFDETAVTERGSYTKTSLDEFSYNGDISVVYGAVFNEVHSINAVGRAELSSSKYITDSYTAIGFPDDNIPNPAFSNEYQTNSKPSYSEIMSRYVAFTANVNYNYAQRYAFDVNLRSDGTTNFGKNRKFTTTYSVGLAWNLHKEEFIGPWADLLKLRGSFGNPGNNSIDYDTYLTYVYNTTYRNHFGNGANVLDFGNENLNWQKTLNTTIGVDMVVLNKRLSLSFDVYNKMTDPLLVVSDIAPSTGRSSYITNLGKSRIRGFDFTVIGWLISRDDMGWSLNLNGGHYKTKYSGIGSSLNSLNEQLQSTSLKRYRDGGSPDDIWAVRSAGIDPMTGEEIFIKADGSPTFIYDSRDEVVVGSSQPAMTGTMGTTFYWKGFSLSAYFRYSFGGDHYNSELHDRIENITYAKVNSNNQDRRALYERWQRAGDRSQYMNIVPVSGRPVAYTYPNSSRYLQRNNYFTGESISVSYDFRGHRWLDAIYLSNLRMGVTVNDIFRLSTVRAERGLNYPFQRLISFQLNLTFK